MATLDDIVESNILNAEYLQNINELQKDQYNQFMKSHMNGKFMKDQLLIIKLQAHYLSLVQEKA